MSWFDDLTTRAVQAAQASSVKVSDIKSFLDSTSVDNTIALAQTAGSNLTVQQLADGLRGGTPPLANANIDPNLVTQSQSASSIAVKSAAIGLPVILMGAAAAYFLLMKRGRRGA